MKERCRETLERAYLFLDGEVLSDEERVEIRLHLERCGPCYERVGLEKEVTTLIARLRGCTPCPQELKTKIAAMIEEL